MTSSIARFLAPPLFLSAILCCGGSTSGTSNGDGGTPTADGSGTPNGDGGIPPADGSGTPNGDGGFPTADGSPGGSCPINLSGTPAGRPVAMACPASTPGRSPPAELSGGLVHGRDADRGIDDAVPLVPGRPVPGRPVFHGQRLRERGGLLVRERATRQRSAHQFLRPDAVPRRLGLRQRRGVLAHRDGPRQQQQPLPRVPFLGGQVPRRRRLLPRARPRVAMRRPSATGSAPRSARLPAETTNLRRR